MLGLPVNDATGGLRAYSAEALRRMDYATVQAGGYGYHVEMTHRAVRAGGSIVEFPITFHERLSGRSKLDKGIIGEAALVVARLQRTDRIGRPRRRRGR